MKTFGDLHKGDKIFWYYYNIWNGTSDIIEYTLIEEPEDCEFGDGILYIKILLKKPSETSTPKSELLDFCKDDTSDTFDLNDNSIYGRNKAIFSPNKEFLINDRKERILYFIKEHEYAINLLKNEYNKK